MQHRPFPIIDLVETGANIRHLRESRGLTVRDVQYYFGFEAPQAIYKWESGKTLPTVDNLRALADLLGVIMDDIIVVRRPKLHILTSELREESCGLNHFWRVCSSRRKMDRYYGSSIVEKAMLFLLDRQAAFKQSDYRIA